MKKKIDPNRIKKFAPMREQLSLQDVIKEANRCLLCHDAPCSEACPAKTDPGKFVRQIKFANYRGAARTIRDNNIMGAACGLLCPVDRLCEKSCCAAALEDPINIGGLQHFATEYATQIGLEPLSVSITKDAKIAVIGAGPAGMSCAYELAKMGYPVTIFEKAKDAGGIAKQLIPSYRLPQSALDYDLKNLLDTGVIIKYNSEITCDAISEMLKKEYQAVFIGIGLSDPVCLPIFNGYTNAMDYVQFLTLAKYQSKQINLTNKRVTVIGGGSVAMDVSCTAAAMGAKKVQAISLESLEELPADHEEIELAHKLFIEFKPSSQITSVEAQDKIITHLKGQEINLQQPGNFSPENIKAIPGTQYTLPTDLVVQAIGTRADAKIKALIDNKIAGIFAGGDVLNKGETVVQAIAAGKASALDIDKYINKK